MTLFEQFEQADKQDDWISTRFVSVDIEGNGCHPPDIVELAIVEIVGGVIGPSFSWLVKPESRITWHASNLHGIHNKDVEGAPSFSQVAQAVTETLGDAFLLSHNTSVEKNLLARKLPEWTPLGTVDTLRLARKLIPGLDSYSLSSLVRHFGLDLKLVTSDANSQKAHRAMYDAMAVANLFFRMAVKNDGSNRTLKELVI